MPPAHLSNLELALTHLGVGPANAYTPQADTLKGELEGYLAAPLKVCDIIGFWQVCKICSLVEKY